MLEQSCHCSGNSLDALYRYPLDDSIEYRKASYESIDRTEVKILGRRRVRMMPSWLLRALLT